ncbi:MAG: hypothetical protein ACM3MN_06105 [Nitrospirota bacterium]
MDGSNLGALKKMIAHATEHEDGLKSMLDDAPMAVNFATPKKIVSKVLKKMKGMGPGGY